jgi:hypothetical protein
MKYLSRVVILALAIFSFLYFLEVKEEQQQWESFIKHFYFSIDISIERIDALIEHQPEGEGLERSIANLERGIYTTERLLSHGQAYVDSDIYYGLRLSQPFSSFLYGIKYSRNDTVKLDLPAMEEDEQLDENEIALLITLRDILIEAREAMYSHETGEENPDLSVEEFNEIIKTTFDRDELEIYRDTFK